MPPSSSSTRAKARSTWAESATSQTTLPATSSSEIVATCAPSSRKRRAVASPIPLVPPVTTTRLPASPFSGRCAP
jgi:hypothetical protein